MLILLLLLLLGYGIYTLFVKKDQTNIENNGSTQNTQSTDDETLTPEETIGQLEGNFSLEGGMTMTIVSPEEEIFQPNQARLWKAKINGIENDVSFSVNCHWKFYLNENNEEVLYREMENRSGLSSEKTEICAFTSTFIDRVGKLRVLLEAEVVKGSNEIVDIFVAEKEYTVQ